MRCDPRYDLVNGSCLLRNCKDKNDYFCEECLDGYKFDANRDCVLDCLEVNSVTGQCEKCDVGKRV